MKKYSNEGCRLTDCCGAYSTYIEDDLFCKKCYELVEFGEGDGSEKLDMSPLPIIRQICAREFGLPVDHQFFSADYLPGESSDVALVRLFTEERPHHESDEDTVMVLVHG